MKSSLLSVIFLAASVASAQIHSQTPYERVLVPILTQQPIAGALGSVWQTTLIARNESDQLVEITSMPFGSCLEMMPCEGVRAHFTARLAPSVNPITGTFLYIGSPGAGKVSFNLRVQDISRQASTWGTAVPIVRERDVFTGKLQLLDIPVNSDFRTALRVYDFDAGRDVPAVARLRVFDMCGLGNIDNVIPSTCTNTPLVDTTIQLPSGLDQVNNYPLRPGFAMIGDLVSAFPELASVIPRPGDVTGIPRVRIDIDPVTPGLRFWAFASVTNNSTQHVTLVTPN